MAGKAADRRSHLGRDRRRGRCRRRASRDGSHGQGGADRRRDDLQRRHVASRGGLRSGESAPRRNARRTGDRDRGQCDDHRRAGLAGAGRCAAQSRARTRGRAAQPQSRSAPAVDPVMLEVFNHLFMAIAEQMGTALQSTAYSVNIKERLDFSCALFDRTGSLVANAPHIPVHLGSMGESVRTIIRAHGDGGSGRRMQPGDVYVLNAPYNGGTHLPDVTVITPVFAEDDREGRAPPLFYVAVARPSRRYRRYHAGLDAAEQPHCRGRGRADRRFPARRCGAFPRGGDNRAAQKREISGAQSGAEYRRSQGADRGQRQRCRRAASHGAAFRPRCGRGLYAPCAGQCRGSGTARYRPAVERQLHL